MRWTALQPCRGSHWQRSIFSAFSAVISDIPSISAELEQAGFDASSRQGPRAIHRVDIPVLLATCIDNLNKNEKWKHKQEKNTNFTRCSIEKNQVNLIKL